MGGRRWGTHGVVLSQPPRDAHRNQVEQTCFGDLTVLFDPSVLRPREWTTAQSVWAAELLLTSPDGPVLELCAGVGQIGLLTVVKHPRHLVMVDSSSRACELARLNIELAGPSCQVEVREAKLEEALDAEERFVGVIADPPWVRRSDVELYPEDPRSAIDGGPEGLDVAKACLSVAAAHLVEGGWLLIQLGSLGQAGILTEWAAREGLGLERAGIRAYERGVLLLLQRCG
jgi:methylase of polypeptide subunit release factors